MYRIPVTIAVIIGLVLLWERPSGWPFVCMFTYFIAGIINGLYVLLFVKQ
jgi:CDP-diacylglycerol--serine O-phosphatidyltransferase